MEIESPATELRRRVEQENRVARAAQRVYEFVSGLVRRTVSDGLSLELRGNVVRNAATPLMMFYCLLEIFVCSNNAAEIDTYLLCVFDKLIFPASLGPKHANRWWFSGIVFIIRRNLT